MSRRLVLATLTLVSLGLLTTVNAAGQGNPTGAKDPFPGLPPTADPGCNPYNAGPMNDVASVLVEARPSRVDQHEAYADCGVFSDPQSLEALRPTAHGPERLEDDGGLPFRAKLCGNVVRYGVNNESNDPRDIMLNIVPKAGFEHFVEGYVNTECTPLTDEEKALLAKPDSECPVSVCQLAGKGLIRNDKPKCIHAEITPSNFFYGMDMGFLPILGDGPCSDTGDWACKSALEPASEWSGAPPQGGQPGQAGRDVCAYGVYAHDHGPDHRAKDHTELCCSPDASHDRPEIHPIDALWFLNPGRHPGWTFAVFQDDSNRYSEPHCGWWDYDTTWSQGPRDLTFHFPFRFSRSQLPLKACLRHTRALNFVNQFTEVRPINVVTALMDDPLPELKKLEVGGQTLLEVVEPAGAEEETQVQIISCPGEEEVAGWIKLRVAVGCPEGQSCPDLVDEDDPGEGMYYAELTFERDCGG